MASKLLPITLLFLSSALLVPSPALSQNIDNEREYDSYDRQIVTKEQLEDRGVARLRDIFGFLNSWSGYSTDRHNWFASANNLAPDHTQNWQVMIDGQLIDMQILGKPDFNALPIRINEIDYIEIYHTPQQHQSVFTDRGLIHIHTVLPKEGVSVNIRTMVGQEAQDAGPYKYTDLVTRNEEASAPNLDAGLNWRRGNWAVSGGYTLNVDNNTDGPIKIRYGLILDNNRIENSRIRDYKHSGSLRAVYQTNESRHHISASLTQTEKYFMNRVLGQELPVNTQHLHMGLSGNIHLSDTRMLEYSSRYSHRGLNSRPNIKMIDYDFYVNTSAASLSYHFPVGIIDTRLGMSLESEKANTGYVLTSHTRNNGRIFATFNFFWTDRLKQETDLGVSTDKNQLATQNAVRLKFKAGRNTSLHTSLTYSERLDSEFHSLWYWVDQGYPIFDEFDISVLQQGELSTQKQITIDFAVHHQIGENLNMIINPFFRSLTGFPISQQEFTLMNRNFIGTTELNLLHDESAQIAGINSSLFWEITNDLGFETGYRFQTPVKQSNEFTTLWDMHPKQQASASLTWKPVPGFMIWSGFEFTSKSVWHEYEPIDGEEYRTDYFVINYDTYHNTVPPKYRVDISARKSFLNERLFGSVRFRNILNHKYLYHPVGSDYDLAMFVIVNLML